MEFIEFEVESTSDETTSTSSSDTNCNNILEKLVEKRLEATKVNAFHRQLDNKSDSFGTLSDSTSESSGSSLQFGVRRGIVHSSSNSGTNQSVNMSDVRSNHSVYDLLEDLESISSASMEFSDNGHTPKGSPVVQFDYEDLDDLDYLFRGGRYAGQHNLIDDILSPRSTGTELMPHLREATPVQPCASPKRFEHKGIQVNFYGLKTVSSIGTMTENRIRDPEPPPPGVDDYEAPEPMSWVQLNSNIGSTIPVAPLALETNICGIGPSWAQAMKNRGKLDFSHLTLDTDRLLAASRIPSSKFYSSIDLMQGFHAPSPNVQARDLNLGALTYGISGEAGRSPPLDTSLVSTSAVKMEPADPNLIEDDIFMGIEDIPDLDFHTWAPAALNGPNIDQILDDIKAIADPVHYLRQELSPGRELKRPPQNLGIHLEHSPKRFRGINLGETAFTAEEDNKSNSGEAETAFAPLL